MTAKREEVVVDTDRASLIGVREAEDLGEDLAQPTFELGAWCASRTADLGDGQRLHVELAVDGHRELGDRGEQGGDHVVGEVRAQLASQLRVVELRARVGGNHVRHQTFDVGCCRIGGRDDCRRRDLWQRGHRGIDLGELDPIAADLHLIVGASEEVEIAVRTYLHRVTGAIQTASVGEGIRDEPLGRQIGPSEVSACQSRAADVQLARHPGGHRPQPRVEEVRGGVPDRGTDRRCRCLVGAHPEGVDRVLGRAVEVVAEGVRVSTKRGPHGFGDGLATEQDERGHVVACEKAVGEQLCGIRGRHVDDVDAVGRAVGDERCRIGTELLVGDVDLVALDEPQQFFPRHVERE